MNVEAHEGKDRKNVTTDVAVSSAAPPAAPKLYECGEYNLPFPFPPYPQQRDLMGFLRSGIEARTKALVVESPTGTGKTQCLLNSCLSWLAEELDKQKIVVDAAVAGGYTNGERMTVAELKDRMTSVDGRFRRAKSTAKKQRKAKRQRQSSEDRNALDDGPGRASKPLDTSSSSEDDHYDKKKKTTEKDAAEEEDEDTAHFVAFPKVFYTSRTHSQLSQTVDEVKRTVFMSRGDFQFVHVASRQQLCVNSRIRAKAGTNSERLNELCIEAMAEPCDSAAGCPYAQRARVNLLKEHLRISPRSLKEMRDLGERHKGCPYLASREFVAEAHVVFLPYGYLTDKGMREQFCGPQPLRATATSMMTSSNGDLSSSGQPHDSSDASRVPLSSISNLLQGSVVVFDEGHNLPDSAAAALSAEIRDDQLTATLQAVSAYSDKYEARLLTKNKQKLRELQRTVTKLSSFDPFDHGSLCAAAEPPIITSTNTVGADGSTTTTSTQLLTLHDFIFGAGLDQVNFFSLVDFMEEVDLRRKLRGFLRSEAVKKVQQQQQQGGSSSRAVAPPQSGGGASADLNSVSCVARFLEVFARSDVDASGLLATRVASPTATSLLFKVISHTGTGSIADITDCARSVVVAGGTLQPFPILVDDVFPHLLTPPPPQGCGGNATIDAPVKTKAFGHVVANTNVRLVSLPSGPGGVRFNFSFAARATLDAQMTEVGRVLVNLARVVPHGLVVFFASYQAEGQCVHALSKSGDFARINKLKKVFRETPGTTADEVLRLYTNHLTSVMMQTADDPSLNEEQNGAMLFCVMGGKLSEGVNFNDHLARCVVVVGLPYPNPNDPQLKAKMEYISSQKKSGGGLEAGGGSGISSTNNTNTTTPTTGGKEGQRYYQALCMRSVNQSIGRCIRHIHDYAAVVLLDERYQQPAVSSRLPHWMQPSVKHVDEFGPGFREVCSFFQSHR